MTAPLPVDERFNYGQPLGIPFCLQRGPINDMHEPQVSVMNLSEFDGLS
jgi:hypothetical protein